MNNYKALWNATRHWVPNRVILPVRYVQIMEVQDGVRHTIGLRSETSTRSDGGRTEPTKQRQFKR